MIETACRVAENHDHQLTDRELASRAAAEADLCYDLLIAQASRIRELEKRVQGIEADLSELEQAINVAKATGRVARVPGRYTYPAVER